MNVIVGILDNKMRMFIKGTKFNKQTLLIDKMCNIKYLTDPINLYIPFGKINSVGLVEKTMVHVEELLISSNVKRIYYGNSDNKNFLEKMCNLYDVEIIKIL